MAEGDVVDLCVYCGEGEYIFSEVTRRRPTSDRLGFWWSESMRL